MEVARAEVVKAAEAALAVVLEAASIATEKGVMRTWAEVALSALHETALAMSVEASVDKGLVAAVEYAL